MDDSADTVIPDSRNGCVCVYLPDLYSRAGDGSLFRIFLCVRDAVLCLSDKNACRRCSSCMAYFLKLMGL